MKILWWISEMRRIFSLHLFHGGPCAGYSDNFKRNIVMDIREEMNIKLTSFPRRPMWWMLRVTTAMAEAKVTRQMETP